MLKDAVLLLCTKAFFNSAVYSCMVCLIFHRVLLSVFTGYCAALPPMEFFMDVSRNIRRQHFFDVSWHCIDEIVTDHFALLMTRLES